MSSQQTVPWWRGGLHLEKLMSINGWTYLVIKILIFMKCAYVFAEQCSSKLKETPQIYGHAAGSERDCGPAGVRGGAGGRRLGGPPAAQLPRLVPRPPLPPHLLRRHLKKENINMRYENNQDLAGALEQVHQNEASPPAPRPPRLAPSAAPPPRSLAGCTGSPPAKT